MLNTGIAGFTAFVTTIPRGRGRLGIEVQLAVGVDGRASAC